MYKNERVKGEKYYFYMKGRACESGQSPAGRSVPDQEAYRIDAYVLDGCRIIGPFWIAACMCKGMPVFAPGRHNLRLDSCDYT